MNPTTKRSFDQPDTTMDLMEKITIESVEIGGVTLPRVTAEPGWVWSLHSKPVQKTETCQVDHVFFMISGRVGTRDLDERETEYATGDLAHIPPGHDGWTIGDEPAIWIEIPHQHP